MQEKSTSLIAAIEGGNKLALKKIFLLAFFDSSNFYTDLFMTDEQKKHYHSSYAFIFILYIL